MIWILFIAIFIKYTYSIPPSCFLSCISEVSKTNCEFKLSNIGCICLKEDQIVGCLIDICPYGTFNSARDHFLGTCLEHGKPSITNPYPKPATYPPPGYIENLPKVKDPPYVHQPPPLPPSPQPIPPPPQEERQPVTPPQDEYKPPLPTPPLPAPPPIDLPPIEPPAPQQDRFNDINSDPWFKDPIDRNIYDSKRPIEWEETDSLDNNGDFIIIRKPINVPPNLRDKSKVGNIRRVKVQQVPNPNQKHHHQNYYLGNNNLNKNFKDLNNKILFKTNRIMESLQPKGNKLYHNKIRKIQPIQPPPKSLNVAQVSQRIKPSIPKFKRSLRNEYNTNHIKRLAMN
ncbi:hypothetical protein KGF54_000887 [Candida jiufengensis]|uniref:uncharacterized protein n=1 Tax=Candida jiufengensis TaxID=497108 RepID=UPI0022243656|nr:uncharacterized protein KGF54_000887 [Candida jiufengensis]KAI5956412.1 hypothetical protein KGF54_000887 [Candida jiufengensis]